MAIQNVSMLSGDHNAELESINRNRQLAMMLQNQSLQPTEQQQPGVLTSPTQGLAKMLQMYAATKMQDRADERHRELATGMNQKLSEGLQNYQKTLQGTPAQPGAVVQAEQPAPNIPSPSPMTLPTQGAPNPGANFSDPTQLQPNANYRQPDTPAVPGDRQAAFAQLLASGHPALQQMGMQQIANEPDRQMRMDEFALRREDAKDARDERGQQFGMMLADRQQGRQDQAELRRELAKSGGAGQNPFFQFLPSENGYVVGNARTGGIAPATINGQPVIRSSDSPSLQGQIAGAKASGKEMGESSAKSQIDLPQAVDTANVAIKQIDDLLSHPGFSSAVGATLKPFASKVDGTPEADFTKRLDQLKGGAFLQAFESLKGGGQITEVEGKKATDAITRMDKAQSETEFANAAREFQGVIRQGLNRAKVKAGGAPVQPKVSIDDLLNKYK